MTSKYIHSMVNTYKHIDLDISFKISKKIKNLIDK